MLTYPIRFFLLKQGWYMLKYPIRYPILYIYVNFPICMYTCPRKPWHCMLAPWLGVRSHGIRHSQRWRIGWTQYWWWVVWSTSLLACILVNRSGGNGGRGFRDFQHALIIESWKKLENQSEGHLETVFLVHDVETRNCPQNLLKSMLILQNQRGLRGRHAVFYNIETELTNWLKLFNYQCWTHNFLSQAFLNTSTKKSKKTVPSSVFEFPIYAFHHGPNIGWNETGPKALRLEMRFDFEAIVDRNW